jgi:predicted DNA-binding transcriptional regulator AlpA
MTVAFPAELQPQAPAPPPEFISAEDIAAILRVSVRTVFRLRARGVLPAPVEVSRNIVRWRWSAIQAYLDNLKTRKARRKG